MWSKPFSFTLVPETLEDNCHFPPESSLIPDKYPPQDQDPSPPHEGGFLDLVSSRTPFCEGAPKGSITVLTGQATPDAQWRSQGLGGASKVGEKGLLGP